MAELSWLIWLVLMVVFAIAEAATVSLVSLWFVGGSLAAMLVNLLGGSVLLQLSVFVLVSAVLLACLRPFVRKFAAPRKTPTNADLVLGREAYLTEAVDNLRGTGALRLDGKEWSVRSDSGEPLPQGAKVKILRLEGVRLYVQPVEDGETERRSVCSSH